MQTLELEQLKVKTEFAEFYKNEPLKLECGSELENIRVAYQTYGELNSEGTNAVLVCHALTGNAHAAGIIEKEEFDKGSSPDLLNKYYTQYTGKPGWWDPLIGPGLTIDTNKYFVISSNILGSCYGTTGPISYNGDGSTYRMKFPQVTVRDMVRVQKELVDFLGVNHLEFIIGGSLGGMQALEWAILYPDAMSAIIPIATSARHSAWAISLGEIGRNAIMNDPVWNKGNYKVQPAQGLSLARKVGMLQYRTQPSFEKKFGRERIKKNSYFNQKNIFQAQSYLNYQGDKLVERFDANSYLYLLRAMDLHDISYGREIPGKVLDSVKCKSLVVGIDTDILYPAQEQREIAILLKNSEYAEIKSQHGHDAFLIEFDQLHKFITNFLEKLY